MTMTRRKFLGTTAVAAGFAAASTFSASSYARILGANDRINMGFMGTNSRGAGLLGSFVKIGGINITNICDVDSRVIDKTSAMVKKAGFATPKATDDIRVMLEDKNVDGIVIAAPDHWHAPAGVMALQAGKHVYVEKPLSHNPHEGEIFIEAQKKYGKIVQMGNQQRSSVESQELIKHIRGGMLGNCYRAETWYGNKRGTIGNGKVAAVPDWLNWELWQGPAPRTEYKDNYVHYNWHWFWDWGTAELCNNAAHELDIARWALDVEFPEQVSVTGGRHFYTGDDWEMYDTLEARYDFKGGKSIEWVGNSCNKVERFGRGRGTLILGTKGHAIVDRAGYEIYDLTGKLIKENKAAGRAVDTSDLKGVGALTENHIGNFLDNVRGTATHQSSPVTLGHASTMLCHLGNIAYRTGETLACDSATGRVKGAKANALWGREFQSGWDIKA
ncbi:MAG: putative dehydrogenase [Psychromonas sp.]|jgi:predicted dehydrogenase